MAIEAVAFRGIARPGNEIANDKCQMENGRWFCRSGMEQLLNKILNLRLWSLFVKEFHQIRRNRRLVVLLIIPPTLNIILFGLALNPTLENLLLGVVDESRTPQSRELVSAFTEG